MVPPLLLVKYWLTKIPAGYTSHLDLCRPARKVQHLPSVPPLFRSFLPSSPLGPDLHQRSTGALSLLCPLLRADFPFHRLPLLRSHLRVSCFLPLQHPRLRLVSVVLDTLHDHHPLYLRTYFQTLLRSHRHFRHSQPNRPRNLSFPFSELD